MRSILEHLKELQDDEYKYYRKSAVNINVMDSNELDDHRQFIFNYFSDGGKHEIVDKFFNHEDGFDRAKHTNSIFFLGCLLYKKLELRDKIDFYIRDHDQFYFIWFLVSLAHDFSYKYEDNFDKYKDITKTEIFDLEHNFLNPKEECNKPYLVELQHYIKDYFEYRFDRCKVDHGIVAGAKLYHYLVQNRIKQKNKYGVEDKKRNLYWGDDLDPLYHCASMAVATHNIWLNENMPENVKKLYPISLKGFPLLFLLGLVDTFDPVKTFDCVDSTYVLDNILINFEDKHTVEIKNADDSKLDFSKLVKKVEKLDDWLNIEKPVCTNDSITIIIK